MSQTGTVVVITLNQHIEIRRPCYELRGVGIEVCSTLRAVFNWCHRFRQKKQSSAQLQFVMWAFTDCLELTVEMHTAQCEAHLEKQNTTPTQEKPWQQDESYWIVSTKGLAHI